jgi:flagellar biogenesis protein FliO
VTQVRTVAIGVALAATVLTRMASAQADMPRDTSATSDGTTPLALRPSKALQLSQEPQGPGLGWKVVSIVAILGGAAFYLRKRAAPKRLDDTGLTIVRRAAIGLRSELLVVNVEGQRLLLGVTPHSIQNLAILDGDVAAPAVPMEMPEEASSALGDRFAAMLKAADPRESGRGTDPTRRPDSSREAARPAAEAIRQDLPEAAREAALAGQARGLAGLRRRG